MKKENKKEQVSLQFKLSRHTDSDLILWLSRKSDDESRTVVSLIRHTLREAMKEESSDD